MTHSPTKLSEFQETLVRLNESECEWEKVYSQHSAFESITQKNLQYQITDAVSNCATPSCITKSSSSLKCNQKTSSKQSLRFSPTTNQPRAFRLTTSTVTVRKSGSNVDSVIKSSVGSNSHQSLNVQLEKRIKQFRESMENIDTLHTLSNPDKTYFLKHLQKMNAVPWKKHKLKNPVVAQLEKYLK